MNTQVLGISVDHVPCLVAWAESLGGINYPLLSDFWPHGEVAKQYDVLIGAEGKTERAIFLIDKTGIIRYIDIHDIEAQPSNDELRRVVREIDPAAAKAAEAVAASEEDVPVDLPTGGVVMYCTKWCPSCRRARVFFKEKGIDFTEVDIPTTKGAAEQVMTWANGNRTSPTFNIDGEILVDWNEAALTKILKEKGYLA